MATSHNPPISMLILYSNGNQFNFIFHNFVENSKSNTTERTAVSGKNITDYCNGNAF